MKIDLSTVNWLAVLVAGIATFVLGGLWYGMFFKKLWQQLHGYSDEKVKEMQKSKPPPVFLGTMIVSYLVMATVLSVLMGAIGIVTVVGGVTLGLLIWLGFAAAIAMTDWISSSRRLASYGLDLAYQLAFLVMMGAILGGWR